MHNRIVALLLAASSSIFAAGPEVVAAWNLTVHEIGYAEPFPFPKALRAHAMAHIAMHDAINAVIPVYREYAYTAHDPGAHVIAAAAQAAYDVALSQYPGEKARLDQQLARWLTPIPDTPHKRRGIETGHRSAAAILADRVNDGWDFEGTYVFSPAIGAYQTTPPWDSFVLQPGLRFAKPFGLRSPSQFRPGPPPPLQSVEYAAAFNEVKDYGRANSTVRTLDQTRYAIWWMEFSETMVNRLARELVSGRKTQLSDAARMFALLNMSLYDAYIAAWDSKYEYNHWRPYTAVRMAALDGNAATFADAAWEPLRTTPPFPEYVSGHAAGTAATMEILKLTFGDNVPFTIDSVTAPAGMPVRSFRSFSSAASECADSRVRLGFHFRYATDTGLVLGRTVANWVAASHLQVRSGANR